MFLPDPGVPTDQLMCYTFVRVGDPFVLLSPTDVLYALARVGWLDHSWFQLGFRALIEVLAFSQQTESRSLCYCQGSLIACLSRVKPTTVLGQWNGENWSF